MSAGVNKSKIREKIKLSILLVDGSCYTVYLAMKKKNSQLNPNTHLKWECHILANRISLQGLFVYLFLYLPHKTNKTEEQERGEIWRS